jgi:quercetin dioxygenase-like cupin family protein
MADRPPLPGAIAASHLLVYEGGGTPHLHTVCTEAYYVIAGHGCVQTLTSAGGLQEHPLEPGAMVWFTPGTIHRLVNDGDLEILVLMQNAGLPEAGDMVITFQPDVLRDADAYRAAATLPEDERTTGGTGGAARDRRDRAVAAFGVLCDSCAAGDVTALTDFHRAAAALVAPQVESWRKLWQDAPLAETARTGDLLAALGAADATHLAGASVHAIDPPGDVRRMGCCGTLGTFLP